MDKFTIVALILSVIFANASFIVYVTEGFDSIVLPLFLTLTAFFFIMASFLSLDFGDEEIGGDYSDK